MDATNQPTSFTPAHSGYTGQRPTGPVTVSGSRVGTSADRLRLRLARLDPVSALKVSFVMSLVLALIGMGASALLYLILAQLGVVSSVNDVYTTLIKPSGGSTSTAAAPVTFTRVMAGVALLGMMGTVLGSILGMLTAVAYNACVRLTGGVRVTVAEER